MKRRRSTVNVERKKLHVDSNRESCTHLEDLSNEVIYEIIEFLDIYHIFNAFSNLNQRFNNLLIYSTLPIKINISSISKSTFQRYYKDIIIPNTHRIKSIHLSNLFADNILFSPSHLTSEFPQVETLILDNIKSNYLDNLLKHLSSSPNLHSLVIHSIDRIRHKNTFYRLIFSLPVLKYCKLSFESYAQSKPLPFSTNESSPIEHLVIHTNSNPQEFNAVLSYVPHLRRIRWDKLSGLKNLQGQIQGIKLKHLTHVSLELPYISFNQFEPLIINLFHQVEVLQITTNFSKEYLDADRWERLILSSMPYLRVFDIQHYDNSYVRDELQLTCESLDNLFTSSFWLHRRWFFTHQFYYQGNWDEVICYSTDPYRRKSYTIYGETGKESSVRRREINLKAVRHVEIQGDKALMNCVNCFPNTTALTLSHTFNGNIDKITSILNRIVPLIQLTNLSISSGALSCEKMIHLLRFTPNVHTLKIYSMKYFITDSASIEKSEQFRLVSHRNLIRNFTVENGCTFEEMKLFVNLCPRLQHINIDIFWKDFESIVELLLSKSNNNTHNLFSLCLENGSKIIVEKLKTLIELKGWSEEYSMELVRSKLYLWW